MMVLVGTLSFNFQVLLPLFARFTWHGTAGTYALLTSAMGIGSVGGALAAGARNRVTPRLLVGSSALFGAASLAAAAAPSLAVQVAALVPLGAASVTFASGVNSTLQLQAGDALRGRVMALYSVVFLGSTPIGAPLVGWLAQVAGPRSGLVLGGVAALTAAVAAAYLYAALTPSLARLPRPWRSVHRSGPTPKAATAATSGCTSPTARPRSSSRRPRPLPETGARR
jgi:MFS family permease